MGAGVVDHPAAIAVIGMACRFPGADRPRDFWSNLSAGVESIRRFSETELAAAGVPPALLRDPAYVRAAPVLDGVDRFDADLFAYSPREAALVDPQQRLFLECCWEALEDAGYAPDRCPGSVGVVAGAGSTVGSYLFSQLGGARHLSSAVGGLEYLTNEKDFLATRVSYKLGLSGPSLTVQTASSTSLVAVHLACQSLLLGECDLALAGGATVRVPHLAGYLWREGGILSPDGHCRAFDAAGQGTVLGSGIGVVVLKPLRRALADGDHVEAVIRGTAINNDGATKVSFAAPSREGQTVAIRSALERAGVRAGSIGYVEAHGSGTATGDPLEVAALTAVFREQGAAGPCALGSVKTNVGHLEAAAGIAALIKAVLALRAGLLPPSLHFTRPNPALELATGPFFVNTALAAWPTAEGPRRTLVNSLGFGGTNACAVLEEAPSPPARSPVSRRPVGLLRMSARTPQALDELAGRYESWLAESEGGAEPDLHDICFTACTGRSELAERAAVAGASYGELRAALAELRAEGPAPPRSAGRPRVAFLFTGQGAQYAGMGRQLYEHEPVFRRTLETCDEILADRLPLRLLAALYDDAAEVPLADTLWAQPALFAIEVALAELWRSWGVEPAAVLGHSVGEYAAACVAGVFSLEDGLRLVAERGRLMQLLPRGGAMAAVQAAEEWIEEALLPTRPEVAIAALNGPSDTVISGAEAAVDAALERIAARGVRGRRLAVSHAFHSALMDPVLDDFAAAASRVAASPPRVPWISNLTGEAWPRDGGAPGPGYWRRHAREPVRFGAGIAAALAAGCGVLLEVGPSAALLPMVARMETGALLLPSLQRQREDLRVILQSLGRLYIHGADVDWRTAAGEGRRVALPTYPFERRRFWLERVEGAEPAAAVVAAEEAPAAPAAPQGLLDRLRRAEASARLPLASELVHGQVCRVLGRDHVGRRDRFFEIGLDSLLALDLRAALAAALGPEASRLSSTAVLDHPDVERLAGHLVELAVPSRQRRGGGPDVAGPRTAEPIAVVGIGCRFPGGASDPEAFWQLVRAGRDCVTEVPRDRFDVDAVYDPDPAASGRLYTRHGAFLDGVDRFDADFFGISPREAAQLDPQQRLLLEVAWEALERAGQAPDALAGTATGVFVGMMAGDYAGLREEREEEGYALSGNDQSFAAGRLSYVLGLHGPSITVDTACSSSLAAVHLACQSLRAGECDLALAAGVNLILSPARSIAYCRLRALSPDGRCKTFDAAADGYGRGEGCGVLVLRRLSDAERRGDSIVALVRGSAVNHDGHSGGLTVPSGPAQERLLRGALREAGVEPATVGYVEAHGTGTALGDPIEVNALGAVLGEGRPADRPLALGSVKASIGHLEAAAGVAGLIKTALVLAKREIPAQPLFRRPSPHIPWSELPLTVPTAALPFPAGSAGRFVGVSSFGLSGTNAHVVLGEASELPPVVAEEPGWHLLRLSARDPGALAALAGRFAAFLAGGGAPALADVCFTANCGRAELPYRLAVVGRSAAEMAQALVEFASAGTAPQVWSGRAAEGAGTAGVGLPDGAAPSSPEWRQALCDLAARYASGAAIDWGSLHRGGGRRIPLPTYPFQRRRHWIARPAATAPPLLGRRIPTPAARALFAVELGAGTPPLLGQHRLRGECVLPAAACLEMALAAAAQLGEGTAVEDLILLRPLALPASGQRAVQTVVEGRDGRSELRLYATAGDGEGASWDLHATCALRPQVGPGARPAATRPAALQLRLGTELPARDFYAALREGGLDLGPGFQWVTRVWMGEGEALALLRPPDAADRREDFQVHPGLLDAGPQLAVALALRRQGPGTVQVPFAVGSCRRWGGVAEARWCHATLRETGPAAEVDVRFLDDEGLCLATLAALQVRGMAEEEEVEPWLHEVVWRPAELPPISPEDRGRRPGRWLLAGDDGIAEPLAALLRGRGGSPILTGGEVPPGPWEVVVFFAESEPPPAAGVPEAALDLAARVLDLLRALDRDAAVPRLVLATRGGQPTPPAAAGCGLVAAPLWGLGAAIGQERPDLRCLRIDFDPLRTVSPSAEAEAVFALARSAEGPGEWICRQGGWFSPALAPRVAERLPRPAGPHRLEVRRRGTLDGLRLSPRVPSSPGPGEVEVAVAAAGLNFRDVMNALGTYPGEAGPLGLECAGVVAARGSGVEGLEVGDRVFGIAFGGFADRVTTPRELLAKVPAALTLEEAATVPVAFLTALLTLRGQARLAPGERVLIHAAAGGVGLAAVQIARRAGALVYATASPGKQELVESLGVEAVFNSRALDFAGELRERTGGRGVDVVLNSLAGEFVAHGLSVVAPGGRFVEIGKTGILDPGAAAGLRPDVAYSTFDLTEVCRRDPGAVQRALGELAADLATGALRPLPRTVWPLEEAVAAFRTMAQGRHVGKLVLGGHAGADRRPGLRPDGTYLVTGGTGALGSRAALRLAGMGARRLAVVGRGEPGPAAREVFAAIEEAGARLSIYRADVADRRALAEVLAAIDASGAPLAGVVHAAGVLADGVLADQDRERLRAVWGPKVAGAWNLHQLTRERRLDLFVLFSSITGMLGGAGQAGYSAANAFLDFLAAHRRSLGLPALAIAWGPWAGVGMAAALPAADGRRWERRGMRPLSPEGALRAFGLALVHPGPQLAVVDLAQEPAAAPAAPAADLRLRWRLAPAAERGELVLAEVRGHAARVLGADRPDLLDPRRPLLDLGLDSLMAIELRNALAAAAGADLPATLIFQRPTLAALAAYLADEVLAPPAPVAAGEPEPATEDIGELLARELESLRREMRP